MATLSSTLKMFDQMSNPMLKIINRMNEVIATAERLNGVMQTNGNNSLIPARTIPDQNRMTAAAQQIVYVTNQIVNNYNQINHTVTQNNMLLNQTNNVLNQTNNAITEAVREQERFTSEVQQSSRAAGGLWDKLKGVAAAYLSIRGVQSGMRIADEYVNTMTRLNIINDGLQSTAELQDKIFAAAARSRGLYTDMAAAVSKMGLLAGHSFGNNDEIIAFTELMQKSFAVSGADTAAQQSAMLQLTQAMAAGRLQGDEFISILENAPMLAQAIAQYTGVGMAGLKEMSSQGLITSDIIKSALFMAADDINAKFEEIPRTFSSTWNEIVNSAMRQFAPIIERVNAFLNSSQGLVFIEQINNSISFLSAAIGFLIDSVIYLVSVTQSGWSIVEPILMAAAMVLLPLMIAKLWAMVPPLVAQAAAWLAINWPILVVIAAIALVLYILNRLGFSANQILGWIAGGFLVLASVIWNTIVGVINAVIQFLWARFAEPWIGIVEWVLNVFNGGFNSFGDAVKNLLGQIISWFLSLGKVVTKIIDAIFGTEWTAGLENLQDSVLKWGKNEQAITLSREAPTIDARINYGDAWSTGYNWGSDLFDGFGNLTNSFDNMAAKFNYGDGIDQIGKVNEVGKIRDTVDISSEDLKMMRELAEMKNIQNFVSLTPTVTVQTGDINNGMDIETIVANITDRLETQIATSARGVYNV